MPALLTRIPRLDECGAPTGPVGFNSQRIIGLDAPQGPGDGVNKTYADLLSAGLDPKDSVRAATTANITLSGAQTIDGVAVVAGNRVLVKNQATASENGVYVAASGVWSRSPDANSDPEVTAGLYVFVEEGTQGDTGWVLTTNNPIALGTTGLSFTQFSGGAGGAASDATLSFSDIATGNMTPFIHGFAPKGDNLGSSYLSGKGTLLRLGAVKEFFVDRLAPVGGDGKSPASAFRTVANAIAACGPYDIIYLCADQAENINISKQGVKLCGVGMPVVTGSGSSSFTEKIVRTTARETQISNLLIRGHATFHGIALCLDMDPATGTSGFVKVDNVIIQGGVGTPTFYTTSVDATAVPSGVTKTGLGGIGVLHHNADFCNLTNMQIGDCSIAIASGTWGTRGYYKTVLWGTNCQDFVSGINTGVNSSPAGSGTVPFPWGPAPGNDSPHGGFTFIDTTSVSNVNGNALTPPVWDLYGDGTSTYSGEAGAGNIFIGCTLAESSGANYRIWDINNVFHLLSTGPNTTIYVGGTKNQFYNTYSKCTWYVEGSENVVDGFDHPVPYSFVVNGTNNVIKNARFLVDTNVGGSGLQTIWENCYLGIWQNGPGSKNSYKNCYPSTIVSLGTNPRFYDYKGVVSLTSAAPTPPSDPTGFLASHVTVAVPNGTPFTIPNPASPHDSNEVVIHVQVAAGVAHGTISVGNKFVLAGGGTTLWAGGAILATKSRLAKFYYNKTDDKLYELYRSPVDLG